MARWCGCYPCPRPAFDLAQAAALGKGGDAARGKRIFDAGDCASCHVSPGQPDRLRLGGGLALGSLFGTFFPPNISPDPRDGIRRLVGFWKLLYLDRTPINTDPAHDPEWNRGRYLVEAVAHCAECHSARNLANAIKESSRFAGGFDQEGAGYVPNITQAGIGG